MNGLRHCGQKTIVIDKRETKRYDKRRRECVVCGERFTTREVFVPEEYVPLVARRNGTTTKPLHKRIFTRHCKDCHSELTESNLIKKGDRICKDCKEARNSLKAERWNARMSSDFRIKAHSKTPKKERIPFTPPIGKQELVDLYEQYTLIQLGAMYNRHAETIRNWLKHYGVNRKPVGSPRSFARKRAQIVQMHESGKSPEAIAATVGYRVETVYHHLGLKKPKKLKPIGCPRCITNPCMRGLCLGCYHRWIRQGKPDNENVRPDGRVRLIPIGCEDCKTKPFVKGLCRRCYSRKWERERRVRKVIQ